MLEELKPKNVLKPCGHTDVLYYYALVARKLAKFLKGKEIAAKNWIPSGPMPFLIKRGSKEKPLFAEEIVEAVTPEFLETRAKKLHLKDARKELSPLQEKVWSYFLPRKLSDLLYATNNEAPGKPIERVFFDLDRGKNVSSGRALLAVKAFLNVLREDQEFWSTPTGKAVVGKPFVSWTGSSFHAFLFYGKPLKPLEYDRFFKHSKKEPLASFTGRWAAAVQKSVGFQVIGGHEKKLGALTIDPSQTPSGKLCRAPFSLHMRNAKTVDGVSVPLTEKDLNDKNLLKKLQALTPEKVLSELDVFAKKLPARFR